MTKRKTTPTRDRTTVEHVTQMARKLDKEQRFELLMLALALRQNGDHAATLRSIATSVERQLQDAT